MNDDLVDSFRQRASDAGIFSDFDGTLSEIVHVPSAARPVPGVPELLARLAARYALIAIVSGRSAGELLEWLGADVEIWGVHGAERTRDGRVELSERAAPHADLMSKVLADAREMVDALGIDGLIVEDKTVMLGLHFRATEDVEKARVMLDGIAGELAARYGLLRAGGRLAYELRPPVEFSKKQVVLDRARAEGLGAVMFLGDDRVDLPAFDALDELATEGLVTVRVGVSSAEAPPELMERADVLLDGPSAVVGFLEGLV
ncbi:MAG: trehalose-phosphatase [Actinomycetota bacterium]